MSIGSAHQSDERRRRRSLATHVLVVGFVLASFGCTSEAPESDSSLAPGPSTPSADTSPSEPAGGSAPLPTTSSTAAPVKPLPAVDEMRLIATSDGERQSLLIAPPSDDQTPRPIVIVLHGHGGSARQVRGDDTGRAPMSLWLPLAEREHIVLAFPDGAVGSDDAQGWNDCRSDARANPETDDVEFLTGVIDDAAGVVPVDRSRVFTVGVSNGGSMSLRMAVERPDLVTGAAAIVASMASDSECAAPTEPVSILLMNGTADPLVDYDGGQIPFRRGSVMSTPDSAELWRELADAQAVGPPEPFPDRDPGDDSTVTRTRWSGAADVWLYSIDGGGHTEPSIAEQYRPAWTAVVGPQNHDIEAAEEIWSFFVEASS